MKRIKAACLLQTVHFMLKDDVPHTVAVNAAKKELEQYKEGLERGNTKYAIVEQTEQADGSIIIKVKKQYNHHNTGEYI